MNEKLQKLYDLYKQQGIITDATSFETFANATPEQQQSLWELGAENGLFVETGPDVFKDVFKKEEPGFFAGLFGSDKESANAVSNTMMGKVGAYEPELKKKTDSTVSPSAESLSELQFAAARARGEFVPPTGTLEEQAKAVEGQESYMGMTVPKAKTYAGKQEVKKEFEKQQEIAASAFDEQAKGTADFNRALSNVNKEMMDFDEEDITPKLQGLFGLYGYKFDYATDAREAVEVTAPNGKKKTIPVDAFTEAGDIESANEFKSFINANKPTLRQTTEQPFYQDRNYNRILNEEEAKQQMANINKITERQDRLESDLKALSINKEKLTRELNKSVIGSPEYLKREEQLNQLDNYIAETNKELDYFNKRDKPLKEKLMASMGSYQKAAAEQGGLLAASYNAALSASGGILAGLNDMVGFLSSRMMEDATTEEKDASYQMVKERSPIIRESLLKAYGITSVSEEYLAAAQDDFLKRNVLGAAAFVPQLAGMAAAPEVAVPLFFLGGYDGTMEKMDNNPKFKNVSEAEKFGVATTAGIINTVLMKYNVGEKVLETAAGKTLMGNVLKKVGSKTGATTIEEVVDNEVKGALSKGLITVAAGASHGFSLGAQIKVGEIVSEELYNKMKEEKLFDTPETFTEAFHQVMESGLDMAMGSVLLGVPKTFQKSLKENNYQGITSEDLDVLNAYANSSEFLEFKKAQVGQKVASREITKEQGVQEIAALETNISIYKSIPENLSDAGKRKAMGLLSEKRQLDSFIQGKDKALVKKQIDRVAEINKQLEALPDMKEEAPAPAEAATPSYSINGKEMSEQEFTKAVSEMSPEDVKKADIKANNATEGVTTLLKEVATRSGVESAPMMETTTPEAQPAKPKMLDEIQDEDLKSNLNFRKEYLENDLKLDEEDYNKAKENFDSKNPIVRFFSKKPSYEQYTKYTKNKLELLKNNPEQYISDAVKEYEESKKLFEKDGEEFYAQDYLDNLKDLQTKLQEENAVQKSTTEEGVLRTEQPQVGLPTMGQGNTQQATTQEGVTLEKQKEVSGEPTDADYTIAEEVNNNVAEANPNASVLLTPKGNDLSLTAVYVKKENRGKGIGTKVLETVKSEADRTGKKIVLDATNELDAETNLERLGNFYEKNGFKKVGENKFEYDPQESVTPAKPQEAKPIEQELAELEQMFPTEVETETKPTIINEPVVENVKQEKNDGSIPLDETVEPSKEGISHANTLGGVAYELPGGIGLVQGFNMFGSRLYSAYKNSSRTNIDIDNFDNSKGFFSDAEINSLKELKKKIEDKEKENEKSFDNPFDKQGRIASSDGVPANIKEFVSALTEKLGVNKKIFIITDADLNEAQYQKHGLFGKLSAIRSAKLSAKDGAFGVKRYMSDADAYYIYYDGKLKGKELFTVISHELGHVIEVEKLNSASKETKSAIKDDYNKWIAKAEGKTVEEIEKETRDITIHHLLAKDKTPFDKSKHSYISSFSEYFADNVSKWTRTSEKPKTLVDKFFAELANTFKRVKNYLTNTGNYSENIFKWLDGMYESKEKDVVTKKTDNLEEAVPMKRQAQDDSSNVDNIVKQARASGYSEKAIEEFLKKRGVDQAIVDKSLGKKEAGAKIVTNEEMMPGYDKVMEDVNSEILRGLDRKTKETTIEKNVMKIVEGSEAYKNATDQQKEQMVRDVKEAFGEKMKPAPSAKKILGLKENVKKITMDLSKYHKQRYEDMEKAEANKAKAIKNASKEVTDSLKALVRKGKITTSQMAVALRKFSKTNVLSQSSVKEFTDYMSKVFSDAEYAKKLSEANKLKKIISRASKNKIKDANLTKLAGEFKKIDPSMVENIDQYNKMALSLRDALKGSSIKKKEVNFVDTVKIKEFNDYINKTIEAQNKKYMESLRQEVQDLLGKDASGMTYKEMIKLLAENTPDKEITKEQKEAILNATKDMFAAHAETVKKMIKDGVDIKQSKKDVVERFMEMDLTKMDIKDAIAAVDALNNFIVNQSTAKMDDVVSKYEGRQNNAELNSKGIVSKPLRLYFNKYIGRVMLEQFANLPIVFERLFKSPAMGAYVQKMMGVTELINNKSKAEAIVKSAVNKFTDKFYKDKANGENFNSSFNNLERGVFADLYRTVIGTPEQVKQEFERNKGLLDQTIKKLSRGTEAQKKESEILQKVYDKIVKDSDSIEDVKLKMDAKNVEAVEYWVEKWAEHYEDLADVSENVYNRILDKELNYTPKRMSKIKEDNSLETEESAFHKNNGTIFKKSTGSLMEATRPDELPENRYVDYSFDSKMANSFQDALVDIYTAANVRKVEAFIKDKGFEEIFPNAEDRVLLEKRIKLMVDNFRNKNHYDDNELSKGMKYINKLGNIGVAAALGGVFQPIKQTVPVAINTLVNAGGINMDRIFSKSYKRVTNEFLDKSGYAIANRGKESTSDIKAIDTMIEDVAQNAASKGVEWTTKKLGKIQDFYLKKLLVNPDVAIARMSWLTYYEKSLKEQGKDVENIDYSDHELNKEAADYAQKMVDRQQNISDADLKGEFFSNKSAANQFISKIIFPFASFRMNQSARLASDFITLTSKTASEQDRKIAARSLAGASAEIAAFNAIGAGLATLLYSGVKSLMADDDEDEEDKKKREEADQKYIDMIIKGRATSAVQDFLSPLPFADYLIQKGVYNTIDVFNGEEKKGKKDEQFNILKPRGREGLQSLGTLGIFPLRMYDLYSITSMASSGTFEDDYGNTKNIREKDKGVLKNVLIPLAAINSTGALPAESYTVQNMILKDIKKRASTQTEAEIIQEKAKKREKRADNIEKIQVINRAINTATDQAVVNELMKMRKETRDELFPQKMSDEAKEVMKRKREREKASYKGLLGGYDTKTDLKRYNPDLYEQNFGEESEYGQTHKAEVKADKLFDAMMKKTKDEKYGYTPTTKKKSKKRKKNSDGSYKSSYFRYSSN